MTYSNFKSTTISSDISAGTTSIAVTNGAIFPASNFNLLIGNELIFCASRSSNTLTCVRGVDGSTAAAHLSGTSIYLLLSGSFTNRNLITKNKLQHVFVAGDSGESGGSTISSGTVAELPSAGTEGNLYIPTNGIYQYYDNGSTFDTFGPIARFKQPLIADFAWGNQGSYTVDDTRGGIFLYSPGGTSVNLAGMLKSAPATPYSVTMAFRPAYLGINTISAGVFLRASSDGKIIAAGLSNANIFAHWYNSYTSSNGSVYTSGGLPVGINVLWLRVTDDGTTHRFFWSADGYNFFLFFQDGRLDFLTPTHIGFFLNHQAGATTPCGMHLFHWEEA